MIAIVKGLRLVRYEGYYTKARVVLHGAAVWFHIWCLICALGKVDQPRRPVALAQRATSPIDVNQSMGPGSGFRIGHSFHI
jgi:hypothetical protein